jgi:hypothetical protein
MPPVQSGTPEQPSHGTPVRTILVFIVIVLILGGLWIFWKGSSVSVRYDDQGNAITQAARGKFAPGFPKELLLDSNAVPEESYTIAYDKISQRMPVARYISSKKYNDTIVGYRQLVLDGGWTITKDASQFERPVTNFTAMKDAASVNITLTLGAEDAAQVEIAYLVSSAPAGTSAAPVATTSSGY